MKTIKVKDINSIPKNFTGIAEYPDEKNCGLKKGNFTG
jgi:hypothetical protein